MTPGLFSRQQVTTITGLSSRQLSYWRKTGLVVPQGYTAGGHARYSFSDLIASRSAKRLLDAKVSLQRIRICLQSLTLYLPTADRPLVLQRAFDALTSQQWVFPIAELAAEVEKMQQQLPEQGDRFPADDKKAGEGDAPDNSNTGMQI